MDWSTLGGILTGVLTVTTIIIGALLGLQRGTMASINERADFNAKIAEELRRAMVDVNAKVADLNADNIELHAENELLKRLNSQSVNWGAVTDLLDHHHHSAEQHWTKLDESLLSMETVLKSVTEELGRQSRGETKA